MDHSTSLDQLNGDVSSVQSDAQALENKTVALETDIVILETEIEALDGRTSNIEQIFSGKKTNDKPVSRSLQVQTQIVRMHLFFFNSISSETKNSAFHVTLSTEVVFEDTIQTIVFDTVTINEGDHYDVNTGMYTAPSVVPISSTRTSDPYPRLPLDFT